MFILHELYIYNKLTCAATRTGDASIRKYVTTAMGSVHEK